MKILLNAITCMATICLCATTTSAAVVYQESFEVALGDWSSIGTVNSASLTNAPATSGSSYAFLNTVNGDAGISAIQTALGLSGNELSGASAQGGAVLFRAFTLNAGDELSFDWRFLSNTLDSFDFNDFAFWSLSRSNSTVEFSALATTFSVHGNPVGTTSPDLFNYSISTFQPVTFEALVAGDYVLGFGVMNRGNNANFGNSGLLIDNISIERLNDITPVPEPATMAMLGLSSLGFGIGVIRKKRQVKTLTEVESIV